MEPFPKILRRNGATCLLRIQRKEYIHQAGLLSCSKKGRAKNAGQNIIALYDHLYKNRQASNLFETYAQKQKVPNKPCLDEHAMFSERLGHSSNSYALAPAQRSALTHALAMEDGEILAVNGPPGTGKTTLILSVVATLWIDAAVKQKDPPIIVASSTNNQAITNIIDAFASGFQDNSQPLFGRWLPEVSSYASYFPSKGIEEKSSEKYQTRYFFDRIEQKKLYRKCRGHIHRKSHKSFELA